MKKLTITFIALIVATQLASAQTQDWKQETKVSVLFGLTQPLFASGFNIEGNFIHKRFIFDYSHGAALKFSGNLVTDELQMQGLSVRVPWTTGFGLGYRFTNWVNLRVEPKWHRFEYYYEGEAQNKANRITADNTFSLGLGLYGFYQPFKNQDNALKGLTVSPSVRYWPTVRSSFADGRYTYVNKNTDQTETLKTLDSGIGFMPLVVNLSVGYTFGLNRK